MDVGFLKAIDVHVHAGHSCRQPLDLVQRELEDAAADMFVDLSGWSPGYFPPQIVCYANSQLCLNNPVWIGLPAYPT
ncbi:MAG: hypothetical protein ABW128_07905 [Rhizorhabdus sp.]